MIELTRLNGMPLFVNCDQIKWAEATPDTMLTLMNGEKVVVRESCADVVERVLAYRVRLLQAVAEMAPTLTSGGVNTAMPGAQEMAMGHAEPSDFLNEKNRHE
jgi:flagellar protein FlbD